MEKIVSQILVRTRSEATYTRERQRVNRERFRAYYGDFQRARDERDFRRASEVVRDALSISNDTVRLVRKMERIRSRLIVLRADTASGARDAILNDGFDVMVDG